MKPIIRVTNVGKQYRIGVRQETFSTTLREALAGALRTPLKRLRSNGLSDAEKVWALKDVSFEVGQGEVLGIIGRNGAGKSTLLKILSRITEPTTGRAELYGRIGSLLEVGTGFHPELTGRENIFLNGAVLGMKRNEIARKFDEIVAFAEIDKFLDTPVKHYSSGMYMRLAFGVAAHLEPEILIIDEVLAVGDAAFQAKCLGKMGDVAREGRTVLFVSHNLGSVANMCSRAILLVEGRKWSEGAASEIVSEYIALGRVTQGETVWPDAETAPGNEKVRLHAVKIISGGEVTADVSIQEELTVEIDYWNLKPNARLCVSIHLLDKMGNGVLASANIGSANLIKDEWFGRPHPVGLFRTTCKLPGNFLNEGRYSINAIVLTDVTNVEVFATEAVSFNVHETGAMRKEYGGSWLGVVRPKLAWQTKHLHAFDAAPSRVAAANRQEII
ncbi:MAG: ABC transporter ATP-binding protein [Pyrinomonadaceae bacterium]|nr:ABC transporter ATP-binding protein [Pyrinomonadaceae bacterium]